MKWELLSEGKDCWLCQNPIKPGEEITSDRIPFYFRYGKQKKKAKANDHVSFLVHHSCKFKE